MSMNVATRPTVRQAMARAIRRNGGEFSTRKRLERFQNDKAANPVVTIMSVPKTASLADICSSSFRSNQAKRSGARHMTRKRRESAVRTDR
jgi:hypothetical protein